MSDTVFMSRALDLAEKGRFSVSPNPMVGCVLVRDDRVIGEGFHLRTGFAHAEVEALRAATEPPAGATAYVTLEPCSHHGRTPPCADALIEAGIRRVVVAIADPHPDVNGRGIDRLHAAGIEVDVGCLASRAERLNEKFLHPGRSGRPFVLLKAGMTLDGKLASSTRKSQWITSKESRERSLRLREEYDAILVGSGTIAADDPQMTRRLGLATSITPWTRVVVDVGGTAPPHARMLTDGGRTILFTSEPGRYSAAPGLEIASTPSVGGELDLDGVFAALHERGIRSVIAEGGSRIHTALLRGRLWQKMILFVAPKIVGGADSPSLYAGPALELTDALGFRFDVVERIGDDVVVTAYPE